MEACGHGTAVSYQELEVRFIQTVYNIAHLLELLRFGTNKVSVYYSCKVQYELYCICIDGYCLGVCLL